MLGLYLIHGNDSGPSNIINLSKVDQHIQLSCSTDHHCHTAELWAKFQEDCWTKMYAIGKYNFQGRSLKGF